MVEISIADEVIDGNTENNDSDHAAVFDDAFKQIALIHNLMSFHSSDSDLMKINHSSVGSVIPVDAHTYAVLQAAMEVCVASEGLFDIRIAGCLMAWAMLPSSSQKLPDYQPGKMAFHLTEDGQVHKQTADWLELGGIAKGYAVDMAISSLRQAGVKNACVNAGGDLRVIGDIPTQIMLRNPANPVEMNYALYLQDQALATSASYFSQKQTEQGSYGALVNGQTGESVLTKSSVSVSARSCMLADALTKVVMASGEAEHSCLAQFGAQAIII
ncbi:FAD:protein FMN transferase [Undibacterium sp. TJN19]|uniref:FAD:protein FMN transferase n=1 Tax=Undibacterium sp. TJN19 TaxID=3413055 RepID=UPI003BF2AB7A